MSKASVGNLPIALGHIANAYNIGDDYQVTKYNEKPNTLEVTLSNEQVDVTVKFKDKYMIEGLINEDEEEEFTEINNGDNIPF